MPHREFLLSPLPTSIHRARELTRSVLTAAGCTDHGAAALVVSELVTNSIVHAEAPINLHIWPQRNPVRLGVSDGTTDPPARREPGQRATSGRGLAIIDRLALRWGSEPLGGGKMVWAEVPC